MRNYIIISSSTQKSLPQLGIFGDVSASLLPNARYLGCDGLYRYSPLNTKHLPGRALRWAKKRFHSVRFGGPLQSLGLQYGILDACFPNGAPADFLFYPGLRIYMLPPQLIRRLKRRYPDSKMICYLADSAANIASANSLSIPDLLDYLRTYDLVCTYDPRDAANYPGAMRFVDIPLWRSSEPSPAKPDADLFFCGSDKGRGSLLLAISARFRGAGLRFRCMLSSLNKNLVPPPDVEIPGLTPYTSQISKLLHANCVLEVLARNNSAPTLRAKEAVLYNKKLLTNNPNIADLPYYDPRWMRYFESAEDIDLDWVHAVEPVDYGYRGDFSAETFLRRVEELTPNS